MESWSHTFRAWRTRATDRIFAHQHTVKGEAPMSVMSSLLEGDPAIRWQVMRDLLNDPAEVVQTERARIVREGWGARILELQTDTGQWGVYTESETESETWMTTIYTLTLLKDFGVDPAAKAFRIALDRIRQNITWWQLDGRPFFEGETEPCLNGRILGTGAYFGEAIDKVLYRLLNEQLEDGGWNCNAPPSKRSSFHTTINVLEGLLEYEKTRGATTVVTGARARGEEYLLSRRMFRSLRTGEIVDRKWMRFAFPPTWHYDILRGLDYLRSAGVRPDERIAEAVDIVIKRRHQNGRWPLNMYYPERILFEVEPA